MRVAFLFGSLNRGGTETLMLDVCYSLDTEEHFEAVGIYRKSGVLEDNFKNSRVPFYHIPSGKNPLIYLFKLRKFIRAHNIGILHAQQPIDAFYAYLASLGLKRMVIQTMHGFDYSQNSQLMSFIIHKTKRNIFVSNFQKNFYTDKYKLKQEFQRVVYNGLDFSKFNTEEREETICNEIGIPRDSILMGMVGNFNEVRDQMTICRFLNLLNKEKVDFHFLFIGKRIDSSPWRFNKCVEYCQKNNLSERVHFLGLRHDVPAILSELDAFIYSTEHDTFGIAVIEAIAVGMPVFVNDWEVMNEITEEGKLATLYKSGDELDLLQKFMLFLHDKEFYKRKAMQASANVREKYSIQQHIENLGVVYNELSEQKR